MDYIIDVINLTKKYGDFTAVEGTSFLVEKGEIFGILGPNGAGKTTTLEMMEGLKPITSGTVLIDGHDVAAEPRVVKSLIGVQLQSSSFFDGLNLVELINTFAAMYGRTVDAYGLLDEVQLRDKAKNYVKELSGGQKQRLSIAVALVNDPKVLFLDEPTTGLDPQARRNLWDLIKKINDQGKTIILTTHYMEEAEVLCDHIAIMDNARIVAFDTTDKLLKSTKASSAIQFTPDRPLTAGSFAELPGVTKAKGDGQMITLATTNPAKTLPALFDFASDIGFTVSGLQVRQPTLEDVFLELTGHALRE